MEIEVHVLKFECLDEKPKIFPRLEELEKMEKFSSPAKSSGKTRKYFCEFQKQRRSHFSPNLKVKTTKKTFSSKEEKFFLHLLILKKRFEFYQIRNSR